MSLSPSKFFAMLLATAAVAAAQDLAIDVDRSTVTIHVAKTGLLSAAGHEHWVSAPISSGTIRETPPGSVEFTVQTAKMTVKPDPKVDAKTQAEIQKDMEDLTHETKKFPQITFRYSLVNNLGNGQWKAEGALSPTGINKPVRPAVESTGED